MNRGALAAQAWLDSEKPDDEEIQECCDRLGLELGATDSADTKSSIRAELQVLTEALGIDELDAGPSEAPPSGDAVVVYEAFGSPIAPDLRPLGDAGEEISVLNGSAKEDAFRDLKQRLEGSFDLK